MEILKIGDSGVMISLPEEDYGLIVGEDGSIDAVTARQLAMQIMDSAGISYSKIDFSLDAFFGKENCLLFASKRRCDSIVLFHFPNLNNLSACAANLSTDTDAVLCFLEGSFYLGVKNCTDAVSALISEFGARIDDSERFFEQITNCGKILATENTIAVLRNI